MRGVVVLVLLIPLLAGCSGSQAPPDDADDGSLHVAGQRDRTGDQEDDTTGDLVGRVHDVRNQSVEEAHVAVLGTDIFVVTDEDGTFELTAPAGQHVLRVTASEFMAVEHEVTIVAAKVIEVAVRLEYADGRLGDRLAHTHNYWGGKDTYTMMDEEVEVHERPDNLPDYQLVFWQIHYANNGETGRYEIPLPDGTPSQPAIVLPGTGRIEVTLEWDSLEIQADHIGISYQSADADERIDMDSKPSGGVHAIDVAPDMTDSGHQVWSFWRFWVWLDNAATAATDWEPTVINGPIHVKIELHRGDEPPIEPGHRDFWGDNSSLVLRTVEDVWSDGPVCCASKSAMKGFSLLDGKLVPPGTQRLEFRFTWWYTQDAPVLDKDWGVRWRTGDQNPHKMTYSDLHEAEPVESGERLKVYEIAVEPHQSDQYYQTRSNWYWVPYQVGEEEVPTTIEKSSRRFAMDIIAYRG